MYYKERKYIVNTEELTKALKTKRLMMALDIHAMQEKLAKVLLPNDEACFHLRVKRVFPWATGGDGLIEYEVRFGKQNDIKILYAQLNHNGKSNLSPSIVADCTPLEQNERELFLSGKCALTLLEPEMSLSTFPFDCRLPWLEELMNPDSAERLLREGIRKAYGKVAFDIIGKPTVLGYRFAKRCTVMYQLWLYNSRGLNSRRITIVGKTFHDERGRVVFTNLEQIWNWSSGEPGTRPLTFSRPLCYVPDFHVYFQEINEWPNLWEVVEGGLGREFLEKSAEALSTFHGSGLVVDGHYSIEDELRLLRQRSRYLQIIRPDLAGSVRQVLASILKKAVEIGSRSGNPSITHRDFYDKQITVGVGQLSFIDLDTVTMADPAIDVGNFLAHIFLRAAQRGNTREEMFRDSDRFVSTYLSHCPQMNEERISFYRATSLLRLASLYAFRPAWRELCPVLLDESRIALVEYVSPLGVK